LAGHATSFLEKTAPDGTLIGLDADTTNLAEAKKRLERFGSRVTLHHINFREYVPTGQPVDLVFADLGLSSPHVDDAERGFTFRTPGPLDLRYDQTSGVTAAQLITESTDEQLAIIFRDLGELQRSRSLAKALKMREIRTTQDAVDAAQTVYTYQTPKMLPQVFQALRIAVNDELGAVQALLTALPSLLKPGGRAGIISYHSLEDRLVKTAFRSLTTPERDPHTGQDISATGWELLTKKPVAPSAEEVSSNPRSRSAKFRAIRRLSE
jgi:16S rRNA (cytosine1402-N4)-methyltransferase